MAAGDITKELEARVRSRTGLRSQQGVLSVHIYAFLSRACHDLMLRLHDAAITEMQGVATGNLSASKAALPADFLRDRQLFIGTGANMVQARRIGLMDLDSIETDVLMVASTSNPYYWIWHNESAGAPRLIVEMNAPSSTSAYSLYYMKRPSAVDEETDPDLAADKHNLLVDYAVRRVLQMEWREDEAAEVWKRYIESIVAINSRYRAGSTRQEREAGARPEVS